MSEASKPTNVQHGGATEGVSQADEGLGLRPAVDSVWSAGGAIPPAANPSVSKRSSMRISIIIATYGTDDWRQLALERAFPSASAQDAFEVIVGHDPDGTIASVRNRLAEKAQGDWLCFLDADDELAPGYIEAMTEAMQNDRLLTPRVQQIINGRTRPARYYPEVNLLSGNWLIVGTLIERSLFEKVGGFGDYPHGFEDWSLWYKAVKCGAEVVRVDDAIYRQHVNPKSKHRQGWKDRKYQVSTHLAVQAELEAWTP